MSKKYEIKENWLDALIGNIAPGWAAERRKARIKLAVTNSYTGADAMKRHMKHYNPNTKAVNTEVMADRPKLISRSRDLYKNNPLARGAINTKVSNVVGTGLRLQPAVDADFLGLTEEQANAWEKDVKRRFHNWAKSKDCDITRTNNFYEIQALAERTELIDGDVLCLLPLRAVPSLTSRTRIQLIEGDRLSNPDWKGDEQYLIGGIQLDPLGAPVAYHISSHHPYDPLVRNKVTWTEVRAFGQRTGRRNVIHLFDRERIGQQRGLPDLTPVIEPLKQLSDYTEYELEAAAVSAMFAVFIKTEGGEGLSPIDPDTGETYLGNDNEVKLSGGLVSELSPGESIETASPNRPNVNFDPFVQAILRQIGIALEIPFEILIKHFTASYSASRAAMLEAWRYFSSRRQWLASNFCQLIYEAWLWEQVAEGYISAPGFFMDPEIRSAYSNANWIGPARGQIDERKEAEAAEIWLRTGVKTLEQITQEETGSDWESNLRQRAKEVSMRREAGLEVDPAVAAEQRGQENAPEPSESEE